MSKLGVRAFGIKMPIFKRGDNIVDVICDNILDATREEGVQLNDDDIIAVTESIVARSEGNYVTVDDIANEIINIFGKNATIGVLWPIYSRNRFSMILKGIARAAKSVAVQLHHGKDEMGNDILNPFTGVNIIEFYRELIESEKAEAVIMQSESSEDIARVVDNIIVATIHSRMDDYHKLIDFSKGFGSKLKIIRLDEICNKHVDDHGYNTIFGLLGSNKASEEKLKLFPTDTTSALVVTGIQEQIKKITGKNVEVMIYGDGCFKDPVCGIWEFADPTTSPAHTPRLNAKPNEIKLKYLVDNDLNQYDGEELEEHVKEAIKNKSNDLVGQMASQGTTPRQLTDLLASLADLCSGSGDRGTPVVLIQGYFSNYAS